MSGKTEIKKEGVDSEESSRAFCASLSRYLAISLLVLSLFAVMGCGKMWGGLSVPIRTVTGSSSGNLLSNLFRNIGSTQITQNAEVTTYAGTTGVSLPANFRTVPSILNDDDGYYNADAGCAANCTPIVSITAAQHAAYVDCGTTQTSIAARISDCATLNGASATWSGAANGNSGEQTWYLVTRNGANKEVWQDGNTGLIWSSMLTPSGSRDNWCRASGNGEAADPSNYCNNVTYQPQYPTIESDCAEPAGAVPTPGWCSNNIAYSAAAGCTGAGGTWTANTDNWATGTYSAAKGGMGANSATLIVIWRLPTIRDYEQAELDGIRHVMPDMGAFGTNYEWSSSVVSGARNFAWQAHGGVGYVVTNLRNLSYLVRCVGR